MIVVIMRRYEFVLVVRAESASTDEKKWNELVSKFVGDGVSVTKITSWGKKQLAYPIKKQTEAVYLLAELEAESLKAADIERRIKLDESVLRFLLTVK